MHIKGFNMMSAVTGVQCQQESIPVCKVLELLARDVHMLVNI